jgi:hypothetical protein
LLRAVGRRVRSGPAGAERRHEAFASVEALPEPKHWGGAVLARRMNHNARIV